MRKLLFSFAIAAFASVGAQANEPASAISETTLSQLGLSGMTVVSDAKGMTIRGKGFKSPAIKFPGNKYTGYRTGQNLKPGYGGLK